MESIAHRDPVTERLYDFLHARGSEVIAGVFERLEQQAGARIELPPGVYDHPDRVAGRLSWLMDTIRAVCERHDFARLLVLFRKMPHAVTVLVLRRVGLPAEQELATFAAVYPEAVLFGTNCVLKFSRRPSDLRTNNDRYRFNATDDELEAATALFTLSALHRHALFVMNSLMRSMLTDPLSLGTLLDVYNRRLDRRWVPHPINQPSQAMIFPSLIHRLPLQERIWRCIDRDGAEHSIVMRNYLPVPCNANAEFDRYSYLDTDDFRNLTGIPYGTFRRVFEGLNQLVAEMTPLLWPSQWLGSCKPEFLCARLEHADDYCETALGGGYPASIWESCHELLHRKAASGCPTVDDCQAVVHFLTYKGIDDDIRFIEQPFLFYPVSDRLLFWDYFRHAGLLRCLARMQTRQPGASATTNKKGADMERAVTQAVSAIPGISGVRKWIYREGGRSVWDVDVGFVCQEVLFLVDVKNEQKSVRYYFDPVEVSDKVARREEFLAKLDTNLRMHQDRVAQAWSGSGPIRGAICLVCSVEAEFIARADPAYWLDLYECPRVCLLSELIEFLQRPDLATRLTSHSAFVTFGANPEAG